MFGPLGVKKNVILVVFVWDAKSYQNLLQKVQMIEFISEIPQNYKIFSDVTLYSYNFYFYFWVIYYIATFMHIYTYTEIFKSEIMDFFTVHTSLFLIEMRWFEPFNVKNVILTQESLNMQSTKLCLKMVCQLLRWMEL